MYVGLVYCASLACVAVALEACLEWVAFVVASDAASLLGVVGYFV